MPAPTMQEIERLRQLLAGASAGGDWTVYSEPEVGLPPSLFAGRPGQRGFDQIEPLRGVDLDLAAEGIAALPALLDFIEQSLAQVGRNAKRQDPQGLGPKDEHAVAEGDAPNPNPQDQTQ